MDTTDAGNYRCLTENIADKRRSPVFSVTVLEPSATLDAGSRDPVIIAGPRAQRTRVGQTVLFECFCDGDALTTTWSREGKSVFEFVFLLMQICFLLDAAKRLTSLLFDSRGCLLCL